MINLLDILPEEKKIPVEPPKSDILLKQSLHDFGFNAALKELRPLLEKKQAEFNKEYVRREEVLDNLKMLIGEIKGTDRAQRMWNYGYNAAAEDLLNILNLDNKTKE